MDTPQPPAERPAQAHSGAEIVLEPTIPLARPSASRSAGPPSRDAASMTMSRDQDSMALLRSRLAAVAGFFLICQIILALFGVLSPDTSSNAAVISLVLRSLVAAIVLGVVVSRVPLSHGQLRGAEIFLFAAQLLLLLFAQYHVNVALLDQGSLLASVAFQKNGVLYVFVLMMAYGVFIPRRPQTTAQVVLTMALSLIICHVLVLQHTTRADSLVEQVVDRQNVIANALFLLLGASLAVFSAYSLRGLRKQLREARRLGQYQLREKLGAGGMGEVYMAEHQLLKRPCALKLIHTEMQGSEIAAARFEREVQSAAMLSHPNTIEVFDYGRTDDGTFYYVMEYLPGMSVHELVRHAGPMPPGRAVYLMRQVCGSLAEAHRMGLVHRDLKPANLFVAVLGGKCDVAKVLDFGLVKQRSPVDGRELTADFTVSGTPTYMSPEQAIGNRDLDGRADIYSLGAILYFMLTGEPPFRGDTPMALMIAHASEAVRPPSQLRADLPPDLEAVILRCLAKNPDERYADTRALADALAACQCAADWNEARAEQWWQNQAETAEEVVELMPLEATSADTSRAAADTTAQGPQ